MNRLADILARRTGTALALLLAAGLLAPGALAQGDARWNALYDRIIRLEHQMKAMQRDYERRIRRLEAQLRAARRGNGRAEAPAPVARQPLPRQPAPRPLTTRSTAPAMQPPLPPVAERASTPQLREPQLSIEVEEDRGPRQEVVLGRIGGDASQPPAGAPVAPPPRGGAASGGPIALPGAVVDALNAPAAPPAAAAGSGAGALAPGRVAVAPLPPPGGGATPAPPAPVQPVAVPPGLAKLSAPALLEKARGHFLARRYDKAEQAYRVWLSRFGHDPKAAEAQFELGETLYIQGRFQEAGRLFVNAYRAAPDSRVAPRALLRLSQALKRMGRKAEACKALASLRQRYPDSRAAKLQAPREVKRLKCKG